MPNVTSIKKVRDAKKKRSESVSPREEFDPCSPDMTICGDCDDNRSKNKCPRLKEWLAKRQR